MALRRPHKTMKMVVRRAGAGTPSYEKPELWFGTANWHGGFCYAPPRPQLGDKPLALAKSLRPRYIFWIPAIGRRIYEGMPRMSQ